MSIEDPYRSPEAESALAVASRSGSSGKGLLWLLFSFERRIPRSSFWGATLFATLLYVVCLVFFQLAVQSSFGDESALSMVAVVVVAVIFFWISLALNVKRWHDRDKSGWWILVGLIPIVGPLIALVQTGFLRGTVGRNRYGDDPTRDGLGGLSQMRGGQAPL